MQFTKPEIAICGHRQYGICTHRAGLQSFAVEDYSLLPWRIAVLCREGLESCTVKKEKDCYLKAKADEATIT